MNYRRCFSLFRGLARFRLLAAVPVIAAAVAAAVPSGREAAAQTANARTQTQDTKPGTPDAKRGAPGRPAGPARTEQRGNQPRLGVVGVNMVRRGPLQQTSSVIGRLVTREGGVIAARTAGPVQEMRAHVGDTVKKGDVLAVLVTDTLRARLEYEKAEMLLATQALERLERLRSRSSAAFQQSRYDEAVQRFARAKANVTIAELALKYSEIRAPFDGVVTKRHTDAGAYLQSGGAVVTLLNLYNLEIEADVPVDRVAGLEPGRKVSFVLSGQKFTATVRAVVPDQNPLARTVAVRFTTDFGKSTVRRSVNQSVTLMVPIGEAKTVVSVHKDAVIARGEGHMVYVLVPTGKPLPNGLVPAKALPRGITIGEAVGDRFEVISGLKPGDIVVTRGNERLRPGQPVAFRKGR